MKSINKKSLTVEEEKKLLAEISILKHLDHPNIIKIYELYQNQTHYQIITEYCEGGNLFQSMQKIPEFNEQIAAKYMR